MNKITLFTLALTISFLFSCKKEEITQVDDSDYLIFGHYFRDCEGESCIETFLITDGKLYEDLSDSYSRSVHFNFVELSNEKYKSTTDLLETFPQKLLKDRRHSFGCPDCSGQGGLYIAYKKEGELKSWKLDPTKKNVPTYLHNFIDDVNTKLAQLNK
ncbi:MAG TPA: hypothetical protein EYG92_03565 [Lutibacter sp.]|nr:hypothetical protein [Lutibacter sp.]